MMEFMEARDALVQRMNAGEDRAVLIAELEAQHVAHADHETEVCDRPDEYELITDLLDCFEGWCAPHLRL